MERLFVSDRSGEHYAVWDAKSCGYLPGFNRYTCWTGLRQHSPELAAQIKRSYLERYTRIATNVSWHYSLSTGVLAGDTLQLPAAPFAKLEPYRDEYVSGWLEAIIAENPAAGLEWFSTFRMRDKPATTLFLWGEPGAGKHLLVQALAALYQSGQYCTLRQAYWDRQKQNCLLKSGLIVSDSEKHIVTPQAIRAFADHTHTLADGQKLSGTCRLVCIAHKPDLIDTWGNDYGEADKALLQHILSLRVTSRPGKILHAYSSILKDPIRIARHILWLEYQFRAEERQVMTRFCGEDVRYDDLVKLTTIDPEARIVLRAIVSWVIQYAGAHPRVEASEEYLLVDPRVLLPLWASLVRGVRPLSPQQVAAALQKLGGSPVMLPGQTLVYRVAWLTLLRSAGWDGCSGAILTAMTALQGKVAGAV
jgi:hypothetical protein